MTTKILTESATEAPVKVGNRWRVRVATPGQGSSGFYSEELLREYGPKAFHKGAKAFINHDAIRSPKDMIGHYPDGAWFDEDEKALMADLEIFPHWKEFVEAVGPHSGISIYMLGESDEDGNVTALFEDRQNGADLVGYPGLVNSGLVEKLYESAKTLDSEKPGATSAQGKEKEIMEEKLDALIALMTTFVSESKAKAEKDTQVEADAETIEKAQVAAVEAYDAEIAKIEAEREHLLLSQIESLRAEAKAGKDVTASLDIAKKIVTEARTTLTESVASSNGRFVESQKLDISVGRWS